MEFETKIAVVLCDALAVWQKTNVTAFLVSGIAGTVPEVVGEPYRDASGNQYLPMFVQPVLVRDLHAGALRDRSRRGESRRRRRRRYAGPRSGRDRLPCRAQDGRQNRRPAALPSLIVYPSGRSAGSGTSCGGRPSVSDQSAKASPSRPTCSPAPPIATTTHGPSPR